MSSTDSLAIERITSTEVVSALRLASKGVVYDLGMEINEAMPQDTHLGFTPYSLLFRATPEVTQANSPIEYSVETIIATLHTSTHIDALVHFQADGRIYGGSRASEVRDDRGWREHGMETVPPIVGRCVMLDIAGLKKVEKLEDRYEITVDDLKAACDAQATELRSGDVVLVRTGKIHEYHSDPEAFGASQPGVGPEAAIWLYEQGMSALGTDTTGTEPSPPEDFSTTTHRAMLVDRGVHLIENVNLEELARDNVFEALFICLPLRLTGATGSWVRPVAIV